MHVETELEIEPKMKDSTLSMLSENVEEKSKKQGNSSYSIGAFSQEDKELAEIFNRTYGSSEKKGNQGSAYDPRNILYRPSLPSKVEVKKAEKVEEYLLVDGYNIIFSWKELNELSKTNLSSAREKLMDILCNYQGFKKCTVILVFDAYKVEGFQGEVQKYNNIFVVYTKEAETADQYIEKTVHEIGRKYKVIVATSDATEQVIIWGAGALRMSAQGLLEEVTKTNQEIKRLIEETKRKGKEGMLQGISPELAQLLEEVRLGKRKL